jgi:hypothetical protein
MTVRSVEMATATEGLPPLYQRFLLDLSVTILHSLEPEDVAEFWAQIALRAEPELLAALPPRPGWTGEERKHGEG